MNSELKILELEEFQRALKEMSLSYKWKVIALNNKLNDDFIFIVGLGQHSDVFDEFRREKNSDYSIFGGAVIFIVRKKSLVKVSNQSVHYGHMNSQNFQMFLECLKERLPEKYKVEIVDYIR